MEILLRTVTKRLKFPIPVLKKYVDDLILALPFDQIEQTLAVFNSFNQHIQFTVEQEQNGTLPFLDMLLIRNIDQTILTRWYSKPISSGRLLNYHSFHPTAMKINVATNFIKRVMTLTTDPSAPKSSIIFQQLRQNNYPSALINRLINRTRSTRNSSQNQQYDHRTSLNTTQLQTSQPHTNHTDLAETTTSDDSTRPSAQNHRSSLQPSIAEPIHRPEYRSIPYIAQLSPTIASLLKNDFPQVKIAYKTLKNIKSILKPVKDPVDILDQSNVVYSLSCTNCQQQYIGMTKNQLKTRISGHKSNMNQYTNIIESNDTDTEDKLSNLGAKTALIKHVIDKNHRFNLTHPKIIDRTYKTSTLPLLEMCHIAYSTNTVNHRTDVQGLSTTYAGLFHTIKTSNSRNNPTNPNISVETHDRLAQNDDRDPTQSNTTP